MPAHEIHPPHELHDLINSTLRRDASSFGRNISFQVQGTEIVLDGVVGSYYQKQMAQESLRYIEGLYQITNRIRVVQQA